MVTYDAIYNKQMDLSIYFSSTGKGEEREKRIENGHQIKLEKESEKAIVNFLFIADI